MPFVNLPNEIILYIAEDYLSDAPDILSLLRTCRLFASVLQASLDRSALTSEYVRQAICVAAANQREDKLKVLVQRARELQALDFIEDRPERSNQEIVRFIMDPGVNLAIQDWYERPDARQTTLLHFAIRNLYVGRVEALLAKGANTEALNPLGQTALQMATFMEERSRERPNAIVELLLKHGADADAESTWDIAPVARAVLFGNTYQIRLMSPKDMSWRFRIPRTNERWRLLDLAVDRGHIEIARALIEKGADPNMPSELGTPLHYAARGGHLELARLLLDKGALIDQRGFYGRTPLHLAIFSWEMVNLLLDRGASINLVDDGEWTVLRYIVKKSPNPRLFRLLVERGSDLTIQDDDGVTALHYTAREGCKASIELLLAYGADISSIDYADQTALHHAAAFSAVATEALLAAGAVVDARDIYGRTPLHYASRDAERAAHLLIEWGADVTAKDEYGATVPDWVLNECHPHAGKGEDEDVNWGA